MQLFSLLCCLLIDPLVLKGYKQPRLPEEDVVDLFADVGPEAQ